jgi:regulator of protease activity HflC (stomatin/prohibitin superfamily)
MDFALVTVSLTVACLAAIAAIVLALSLKRIPEGEVYTLHRRRPPQLRLLTAGTHWIVPLRDHIVHKISLTGRTLKLDASLADDSPQVDGTVYWQVLDAARADAVIEQAESLIRHHALDALRAEKMTDDALRHVRLKNRINAVLRPQGLLVTRMDVRT